MSTYAEIQSRVLAIVIDTPTAVQDQVPTLVKEVISELQVDHNFQIMRATTAVLRTVADTRVLAAVPSDFKEFRGLPYEIGGTGATRELGVSFERSAVIRELGSNEGGEGEDSTYEGRPQVILVSEPSDEAGTQNFEIWPLSDGNSDYADTYVGQYRIRIPYWKYLTELSGDTDTNWFTVNGADYIAYMAAAEAFFLDHDEQNGTIWTQKAGPKRANLIKRDKMLMVSNVRELIPSGDALARRYRGPSR